MKFNIITVFPELIAHHFNYGVCGAAVKKEIIGLNILNLRDFTTDKHQTVDDKPFSGSDGMLLKYEPLSKAVESLPKSNKSKIISLSPQGRVWSDAKANAYAQDVSEVTFVCGRYAGIDQRFVNKYVDEEISIGDYVISGGEMAAVIVMDSIMRKIPGVLGNKDSSVKDSFAHQLLEAPAFTRPREIDGESAPEAYLSGNHKLIKDLDLALSVLVTHFKRPDLISDTSRVKPAAQFIKKTLSKKEIKVCGLCPEKIEGLL